MAIDPREIELSDEQRAYLARQAELAGKPWQDLLDELLPFSPASETTGGESAYDAAIRLGLIGGIKDGPIDLSTNPAHMEGFGK